MPLEHRIKSTVNTSTISVGGGDVAITNTGISIGNSTVNSTIHSTFMSTTDLTVSGNLTVSGTQTIINTETLTVNDNIIVLNSGTASSPSTNSGIEVERGTSNNVSLFWDETSDTWSLKDNGENVYAVATNNYVTTYASNADNISSGTLDTARLPATANIATAVNIGANVNISTSSVSVGNSTVNTSISATGIERLYVTATGEAYALSSSTYDLYDVAGSVLNVRANANSVNSGALISFNAYNSSNGATGVFLGGVAGGTGNGPASLVFGRRTGTTSWAENARFDTDGHFIPSANVTYDLGSSSLAWRNIYTGDLHLSNEQKEEGNSIDGSRGNWTIQEGEDSLFIINNKNGKKYRFNLEEV